MTHGRLPLLTAAAIVVTTLAPASAQAAVPARTLKPADTATPSVVRTVYTDVNGDGKRDTVTLTYLGSNAFALTVKTTTGKTSTVRFTSHVSADVPASASWYGASAIDGRSGSELIVARYPASRTTTSDDAPISVYTWRSGKLAAAKVPASPVGTDVEGRDQLDVQRQAGLPRLPVLQQGRPPLRRRHPPDHPEPPRLTPGRAPSPGRSGATGTG